MAMIGTASASAAPWITLRPMPPTPMTSTLWPWVTLARLNTAPTPVMTPQPSSDATSKGTSLLIGTAWRAFTTVCSVNAPMLANWKHLAVALTERRRHLADRLRGSAWACRCRRPRRRRSSTASRSRRDRRCSRPVTSGPTSLDDARALVAEHHRRRERDGAVDHAHVAVAHAGGLDLDPHLVGRAGRGPQVARRRSGRPRRTQSPSLPHPRRPLFVGRCDSARLMPAGARRGRGGRHSVATRPR